MTQILVALIGAAGLVATTWLTTRPAVRAVKADAAAARQSAEKAVEQTLPVSNGFARKVLDHIARSDDERRARVLRDAVTDSLLIKYGDRLTSIENALRDRNNP